MDDGVFVQRFGLSLSFVGAWDEFVAPVMMAIQWVSANNIIVINSTRCSHFWEEQQVAKE